MGTSQGQYTPQQDVPWKLSFTYRILGTIYFGPQGISSGTTFRIPSNIGYSTIQLTQNPNGDRSKVTVGCRGELSSPNKLTKDYGILLSFEIWKGRLLVPNTLELFYIEKPESGHGPYITIEDADLKSLMIEYQIEIISQTPCPDGGSLRYDGTFVIPQFFNYDENYGSAITPISARETRSNSSQIFPSSMAPPDTMIGININSLFQMKVNSMVTRHTSCDTRAIYSSIIHKA